MKKYLIKFIAILNTLEGVIHLVVALLGFWGVVATYTFDWRVLTPPIENLIFGLFSIYTGLILGKWGHDHDDHKGE
jgi:hypothetical protein